MGPFGEPVGSSGSKPGRVQGSQHPCAHGITSLNECVRPRSLRRRKKVSKLLVICLHRDTIVIETTPRVNTCGWPRCSLDGSMSVAQWTQVKFAYLYGKTNGLITNTTLLSAQSSIINELFWWILEDSVKMIHGVQCNGVYFFICVLLQN